MYIGEEIPEDHPYYVQKKLNSGPNQWPQTIPDKEEFQKTTEYYHAVYELAEDVLSVIALTLGVESTFFKPLTDESVATIRYLHYPTHPKDQDEKLNRGIGAHMDFGCVTHLLQDEVDGLQVLDASSGQWLDASPSNKIFILKNRTNKSNIHRVINKSHRERYLIPFFFSGNPDYLRERLPNCRAPGEAAKYAPITVQDMVTSAYKASYGRAEQYKEEMEKKNMASSSITA
ncbi:Sexual differentiation process protein isp7 [Talaromyces pinophilus]|nr:Sexual differentiation process protein isp7 [Talaromyces pinophilus]